MKPGIDPVHRKIIEVLVSADPDPLTTEDAHRLARFGTTPSVEGVGRRLKTLQARGWVERRDYDHKAAWGMTEEGRRVMTEL